MRWQAPDEQTAAAGAGPEIPILKQAKAE